MGSAGREDDALRSPMSSMDAGERGEGDRR
jgi:hypothetical protein